MTPLSTEEIEEARKLEGLATPGPWDNDTAPFMVTNRDYDVAHAESPIDARFIAAARTLVPRLLATVDVLTAEERKWRRAGADGIDRMADHLGAAQAEIERLTKERDSAIVDRDGWQMTSTGEHTIARLTKERDLARAEAARLQQRLHNIAAANGGFP